jgi:superfamily II DNA or RNA helicase
LPSLPPVGEVTEPVKSMLRDLALRPIYIVPRDDLIGEVLVPCLRRTMSLDCMFGYFGSGALADLAPGLAEYLNRSTDDARLIIGPYLQPQDLATIEEGLTTPATVLEGRLLKLLGEASVSESALVRHTLECLAYLIATSRLEIKVSFMRDGQFHDKVWFFNDVSGRVVVSGSSNLTRSGLARNHEQVRVERSWEAGDQRRAIKELSDEFGALWQGQREYAVCLDLPVAVRERLIHEYRLGKPPSANDFEVALNHDRERRLLSTPVTSPPPPRPAFHIPTSLQWEDGPYRHQGAAVRAFEAANRRGVLQMATGAGKTITALIAAHRLYKEAGRLLIVIAAPTLPLVAQWRAEAEAFGLEPVVPGESTAAAKLGMAERTVRQLIMRTSDAECLVVTHHLLCDSDFQAVLARYHGPVLLVGDEVHNLGREAFLENPPDFVRFRLGLSATPIRQYDEVGTDALLAYFGGVVYEFTLEDAIGVCLVPYDYFVHVVRLTDDEMNGYLELTERIKRTAWRVSNDEGANDDLQILLNRRRKILENAEGKLAALRTELAGRDPRAVRHMLIYATDKGPEQLEDVNSLLYNLGLRAHQLTAEETQDGRLVQRVLTAYRDGAIQVLTAKRVLDEGLNVPEITEALILASTTVERQWVQRRGRILRPCVMTGKDHAVLHDFLVLPPESRHGVDEDTRRLIRGEVSRIREFARLARNAAAENGPRATLHPIILEYFG